MLGRSALANPYLAKNISNELGINRTTHAFNVDSINSLEWHKLFSLYLVVLDQFNFPDHAKFTRLKQWATMANMAKPRPWVKEFRVSKNACDALNYLVTHDGQVSSLLYENHTQH